MNLKRIFESVLKKCYFTERCIPIDYVYKDNSFSFINNSTGELIDKEIVNKLKLIPRKRNWSYVCSSTNRIHKHKDNYLDYLDSKLLSLTNIHKNKNKDKENNAFSVTKSLAGKNSFLILADNDPVGIVVFMISNNLNTNLYNLLTENSIYPPSRDVRHIREIGLLGFKDSNFVLARDLFNLLDTLIKKYPFISWSVDNSNPVKKMYDRVVKSKRYNMLTSDPEFLHYRKNRDHRSTQYVIIGE